MTPSGWSRPGNRMPRMGLPRSSSSRGSIHLTGGSGRLQDSNHLQTLAFSGIAYVTNVVGRTQPDHLTVLAKVTRSHPGRMLETYSEIGPVYPIEEDHG